MHMYVPAMSILFGGSHLHDAHTDIPAQPLQTFFTPTHSPMLGPVSTMKAGLVAPPSDTSLGTKEPSRPGRPAGESVCK
jgi:hypothetical protein